MSPIFKSAICFRYDQMLTLDNINHLIYLSTQQLHIVVQFLITVSTVIYDIFRILSVAIKLIASKICTVKILQLNSVAQHVVQDRWIQQRNRNNRPTHNFLKYCYKNIYYPTDNFIPRKHSKHNFPSEVLYHRFKFRALSTISGRLLSSFSITKIS